MTELQNEIEELLGPAVQVDDEVIRACQERDEFGGRNRRRTHHEPQPSGVRRISFPHLEDPTFGLGVIRFRLVSCVALVEVIPYQV